MTHPTLEVVSLHCVRGRQIVVEDASFALQPGEHVALTGENGSGKSTLLRAVLGLDRPREGRVYLQGRPQVPGSPAVLRQVTGIGHDLQLDEGIGVCGKGGQSVPAGVGQPTLLIEGLTVGGTA